MIRSTWFILLMAGLLVACAAPAPTSAPAPATQPEPTQPATAPTSTPGIPGEEVVISVAEDNETFNAKVTGNGEIGVILADSFGYNPARWLPLVDALAGNENLRMVTFTYRDEDATPNQDTRAVFDYLRAEGIDKILCVGAGYGSRACGFLQGEPEIIGMVMINIDQPPQIEGDFPKLLIPLHLRLLRSGCMNNHPNRRVSNLTRSVCMARRSSPMQKLVRKYWLM
jgi:hypothetical protein